MVFGLIKTLNQIILVMAIEIFKDMGRTDEEIETKLNSLDATKNITRLGEAERRVFYVAFTRAKQRVVMLVPTHVGDKETTISPYVQELGLLD